MSKGKSSKSKDGILNPLFFNDQVYKYLKNSLNI